MSCGLLFELAVQSTTFLQPEGVNIDIIKVYVYLQTFQKYFTNEYFFSSCFRFFFLKINLNHASLIQRAILIMIERASNRLVIHIKRGKKLCDSPCLKTMKILVMKLIWENSSCLNVSTLKLHTLWLQLYNLLYALGFFSNSFDKRKWMHVRVSLIYLLLFKSH